MDRRGFLQVLGLGVVAAATFDPASLLWTPTKTIFLPPIGGWSGRNTLITQEWIMKAVVQTWPHKAPRSYGTLDLPLLQAEIEQLYADVEKRTAH